MIGLLIMNLLFNRNVRISEYMIKVLLLIFSACLLTLFACIFDDKPQYSKSNPPIEPVPKPINKSDDDNSKSEIPKCFINKPKWIDPIDGNIYKNISIRIEDSDRKPRFNQFEMPSQQQIIRLEKECYHSYSLLDYFWLYNQNSYQLFYLYGLCIKTDNLKRY